MAEELELLERLGQASTTVTDCWCAALERLRAAVPESTFKLWLEPLDLIADDGHTLILSTSAGVRTWVERRYLSLIQEAIVAVGETRKVEFICEIRRAGSCQ